MAKKPSRKDKAKNESVNELVEEINRMQATTHALLEQLLSRMPEGRRETAETGRPWRADPVLKTDARFLAMASVAESGADETILRDLADSDGLRAPVERLIALRNERYPASRPRYWGVVDFDLSSAKERLFVLDVVSRTTESYLCAHGIGSEGDVDDEYAKVFSNRPGSKMTSLGIYRCAETYNGSNGYSMRLDGLEDTNSNARSRYIVMHGAHYVSWDYVENHRRIGRSEGCPALDHQHSTKVIDQLKLGSLLIHWQRT